MLLPSFSAAQCEECKYTTTGSQPQSFADLEMVLQPGFLHSLLESLETWVSGGTVLGRAGPRGIAPAKVAIQVPYKDLRKVKVGELCRHVVSEEIPDACSTSSLLCLPLFDSFLSDWFTTVPVAIHTLIRVV